MAAEESLIHLLHLFDSLWFENHILHNNSNSQLDSKLEDENELPKLARISIDQDFEAKKILINTSQESLSSGDSENLLSPNSVLMRSPAKLENILSKKESPEQKKQNKKVKKKINEKNKKKGKLMSSKSLSELEFEEVKGFMDLGFVFSEGDKNSSLVKIIPGLQRFGEVDKEKEEKENGSKKINGGDKSLIRRPYLSQAWEIMEYRRRKEPAEKLKWKINAAVLDNEMDMKNHLKFWAQSVASAVK
ncbi:hypothetical protein DCAR_0417785 [Daucus carota subsp. sativus]|uniref:Uncharacterized protein n=1 Tax=Daucus carota subsp. sativus TaxID=79200 RepID=A0A165YXJ1_DAUCS|nr:hypothetical protein DCAR_0417785 [Daucus carota subsp. sativus]